MANDKYDVFISYSRKDFKDENNQVIPDNVISKIITAFKKNGITYWIDEDGIYTGDNFAPIIAKAIKSSSVFVFVSTENSNKSEWVQSEIAVAQIHSKNILPIRCDASPYADSVIMYLAMLDFCDYVNAKDDAIQKLVKSVLDKISYDSKDSSDNPIASDNLNYKQAVIDSLSEINNRIVDVSQIAVSQILESNSRSRYSIKESCDNLIGQMKEFSHDTEGNVRESVGMLNESLQAINENQKRNIELQEQTIKLLEKIASKFETSKNEPPVLTEQPLVPVRETPKCAPFLESSEIVVKRYLGNIFLIVDESLGPHKLMAFNRTMRAFFAKNEISKQIPDDVELKLSTIIFSTDAKKQYPMPININEYEWTDIGERGKRDINPAFSLLCDELRDDSDCFPSSRKILDSLIIFILTGNCYPSLKDNFDIKNEDNYRNAYKKCIFVGKCDEFTEDYIRYYFDEEITIPDMSSIDEVLKNKIEEYIQTFNE